MGSDNTKSPVDEKKVRNSFELAGRDLKAARKII